MSTIFSQIYNALSGFFENISQAVSTFTGAISNYMSKPAILPPLWSCLPSEIRTFFISCLIVIGFVTALNILIRKAG